MKKATSSRPNVSGNPASRFRPMQESLKLSVEVASNGRIRVSVEETPASVSCDAWLLRLENSDGEPASEPFQADGRSTCIDLPQSASLLLLRTDLHQRVVVEGVRKVTSADDGDVRSCYVIVSCGKASLQPALKSHLDEGHDPAGICASRSLNGVSVELSAEQTTSGQNVVHIRSSEVPDLWQIRLLRRTLDQRLVLAAEVFYIDGPSSWFEVPVPLEPETVYEVEADGLVQVGGGGGGEETAEDKSGRSFLILCSASATLTGRPTQTTLDKYEVDLKVEQPTTYREAEVLIQNRNRDSDQSPEFWLLTINRSDSYRIPANETKFRIPGWFDAGLTYLVSLRGMLEVKGEGSKTEAYVIPWQKEVKFKAELTPSDIRRLLRMAVDMESSDSNAKKRCVWLYRNKSPEYFDEIFRNNGGIMAVRPKDNSGDPGSPINGGRLKGLFFMASVDRQSNCGDPIPVSPYGSARICVDADRLVNASLNVYFTDFYCMKPDSYHYVTLVVTKPDSEVDLFCARRLVKISVTDQSENPFLFLDQSRRLHVTARRRLLVEVFYTEDLDIGDYEERLEHGVRTVGTGSTSKAGIPKYPFCTTCNLYPRCETYQSGY